MTSCPASEELARLIDGELTENRTRVVRGHADGCAACRAEIARWRALVEAIAIPIPPRADAADHVLARLRSDSGAVATTRAARRPWFAALALAAIAALIVARATRPDDAFTARGAAAADSLDRDIDVRVYAGARTLRHLGDGDAIASDTPLAVAYRNLGAGAYLMVFAVDAAGDVHWIAPAYATAGDDPASVPLAHAEADVVLPSAMVLDRPAPGILRVFRVVTATPLHVSLIEAMPGIDERALRARWPDANISSIALELGRTP